MIDHLTDFPHDRRAKQEISGATTQTQANFDALKSHSQSTAGNVSNEAGNTVKQIRTAAEEAADTAADIAAGLRPLERTRSPMSSL